MADHELTIRARLATALPEAVIPQPAEGWRSEFMVMPGGVHEITAAKGDQPIRLTVQVDRGTAAIFQEALRAHQARGQKRPYFDFDHDESAAAAWPEEFFWREEPRPGVYVRALWSKPGAEAVHGRTYRSFSPAFTVDRLQTSKAEPARVKGAPLCMGGLVNDPAFAEIAPLWARHAGDDLPGAAGGSAVNDNKRKVMNEQELAALKAKLGELEQEITALKAKRADGDEAAIKARNTEIKLKESEAEVARVKIEKAEADAKIVSLGAEIKARNEKLADEAIKAAVGRGAIAPQDEKIQAKYRELILSDPSNVVLLETLPANPALAKDTITAGRVTITSEDPRLVIRAYNAEPDPMRRGVIYAKNLRKLMSTEDGCDHVIRAADTLVAPLVVQRTLDLLKLAFPQLSRISTNFSGENAAYGEAITTRLVSVPAVGTYHTTNGYVSSATTTLDVPVTINAHKFVQVEFGANSLGGTRRLLFGEQEEAMHYALGKDLVDAIYALFLAANYTETPTVEALVDFDRTSIIQLGIDMNTTTAARNANTGTRTALLSSAYYGKLAEDVVVVSNLNNPAAGGVISSGVLPMVHGFLPVEAPNLPTTANLVGVGLRADAVALAVRPANDYASAQPGLPATGNMQQVTNPDTGLTVTLTQYVDHYKGKSYMRLAWMYGVAVGNPAAGQLIKSAA